MGYRISCLTNGQMIRIPSFLAWDLTTKMPAAIKADIKEGIVKTLQEQYSEEETTWEYLEFNTEDSAKWFISHRLTYNPARKDPSKIFLMKALFKFNYIDAWETIKLEFETTEVF